MKFILPLFLLFCTSKSTLGTSLGVTVFLKQNGQKNFYITNYCSVADIYLLDRNDLVDYFGDSILTDTTLLFLSSGMFDNTEFPIKLGSFDGSQSKYCFGFVNYGKNELFFDLNRTYKIYYKCNNKINYIIIKDLKIGYEQKIKIIN